MERFLNLVIVAPEKVIFEGDVESLDLPGIKGQFTVLPMHAALITSLSQGKIRFVNGGETTELLIKSGFVEIRKDKVSVCIEQ
ncbi:MAG: ATP synthase F1 subunit epsilon [Parabacteroides sp.]|nr:ATP synthase F1 subunit epsilon [Parabacteroides sp.]